MRDAGSLYFLAGLAAVGALVAAGGARAEGEGEAEAPAPVPIFHVRVPAATPGRAAAQRIADVDGVLQGFVVTVGGGAILTPAVEGRRVFAGDGVEMKAFDALDGRRLWTARVDDSTPTAPAVSEGRVYFNTESCTLYGVEASSGVRGWSRLIASTVMSTPAVCGDRVFVTAPSGLGGFKLEAYSARRGGRLFSVPLPADAHTAPVASGDRLYLALTDGTVLALDLDGKTIWKREMDAVAAPWPHGGRLLLACGSAAEPRLLSLDAVTGEPGGRSVATPGDSRDGMAGGEPGARGGGAPGAPPAPRPAAPQGPVAGPRGRDRPAPTPPGVPAGVPPAGAFGAWTFGFEGPRPCVLGDTVAMAGKDFVLLQTPSGARPRRVPLGAAPAGATAAAGTIFLQAVADGRLLGIDPGSGDLRFEVRFTGAGKALPLCSSPAVSRGRAYLGTADGRVLGVDLPDASADGWPMWGGSPTRAR